MVSFRHGPFQSPASFSQEDGTLLADVAGSFVKKFESYALQRSMGQQLIEYAFPARRSRG